MNKNNNHPTIETSEDILKSLGFTNITVEEIHTPYYNEVLRHCDMVSGKMKLDHVGRLVYREDN